MTLDELLTQLMKIKEVYPDSGSFRISLEISYTKYPHDIYIGFADKVLKNSNSKDIITIKN